MKNQITFITLNFKLNLKNSKKLKEKNLEFNYIVNILNSKIQKMKHMNQIYQSIIEFHYGIHFDLGHKYEQIDIECFQSFVH